MADSFLQRLMPRRRSPIVGAIVAAVLLVAIGTLVIVVIGCPPKPPEPRPEPNPVKGQETALGSQHATLLLERKLPRETGSARLHARIPTGATSEIIVEILNTDMKDPCVRVEKEIVAGKPDRRGTAMVANQVVVKFRSGEDHRDALKSIRGLNNRFIVPLRSPDAYLITVPEISCSPATTATILELPATLRRLEENRSVEYAEPNYLYFTEQGPTSTELQELWGLHNFGRSSGRDDADIDASEGWAQVNESPHVLVGIIDTGIDYEHPDLEASIWTNPGEGNVRDGIDNDGNGYVDDLHGWDFYNRDNDPMDEDGHGTHVAGTIGADGHNGKGAVGVSWRASLVALKFMQSRGGNSVDASEAVRYAIEKRIRIVSNSWGGDDSDAELLYSAIRDAAAANGVGMLFVASAGNHSVDNDVRFHFPSSFEAENVIAVAASNDTDGRYKQSNYGATSVDLAAPGNQIYSTLPKKGYGRLDGTSMAAAYVSGACALLWARRPQANYAEIRTCILRSTDPIPAFKDLCVTGGRLNLDRALRISQN